MPDVRLTKNQKKRLKKKEQKANAEVVKDTADTRKNVAAAVGNSRYDDGIEVEVEYVSAELGDDVEEDPALAQFKSIFEKFAKPEELTSALPLGQDTESPSKDLSVAIKEESDAVVKTGGDEEGAMISKKKKKLMSRLSVAELKQLVQRPDVVEAHDVTASDPRLLVYLKAYRNTVPVPRHWCAKRKYLQGKRGIEKAPFQLPEFIAETGITKIREAVMEQEALKKSKQKARDRVQPKLGKVEIDYQVLRDAFFKYQTKPKLTMHGDLYYEGKEFEVHVKEKKPGVLSKELMEALGMESQDTSPPPYLINMQRYGPPPSYPSMRIPGLSAPIPQGAQFGYQAGGWGKPPVDEYGRPLYGDVFGVVTAEEVAEAGVDKANKWGELTVYESEEEEEEGEEDGDEDGEAYGQDDYGGMETPSTMDGISTVQTGLETPDTVIDLRKRAAGMETPDSVAPPRELYQVIGEKTTTGAAAGQLFGSDRTYVMPGKGDVQMSINPDELEDRIKDKDHMREMYDAQQGETGVNEGSEDATGKRKRRVDASTASKRYKDFKF